VTLTPRFTEAGPMPAVYVRLALAGNGFAGGNEQLALEHAELNRFLVDLERLVRDRRGAATLTRISPTSSPLPSASTTAPAMSLLTSEFRRHVYVTTTTLEHHVAIGFEFDPTDLPRVLRDFQDLLAFRRLDF
jgi:hypothetical protein